MEDFTIFGMISFGVACFFSGAMAVMVWGIVMYKQGKNEKIVGETKWKPLRKE